MGQERNEKYDDETEYHFSDDQANYEIESEIEKNTVTTTKTTTSTSKLSQYQRPIIGTVVVIILIFAAYKTLAPAPAVAPPEEITQVAAPAKPVKLAPPKPVAPPEEMAMQPSTIDKLSEQQEQSNQQLSQMQNEFAQKLSEYDAQNNMMQGKLDDLSMRMASLEANINRLSQIVEDLRNPKTVAPTPPPPPIPAPIAPKVVEPIHTAYTVQAIIPGRAWLKSENGETVTVAEGDVIKGFGRVTKIDPYDGIVNINIGDKTISLSYGISAE